MAPTWFITGASGFIGSHLLSRLVRHDLRLRLLTSHGRHQFRHLHRCLEAEVVTGDIARRGPWQEKVGAADLVLHMAVFHHAYNLDSNELAMMDAVNISGTRNLLAALEAAPPRRFILVSSVKVTEWERLGDLQDKEAPEWAYARSKHHAEQMVRAWCQERRVDCCVLRLAPVYGRGNSANLGTLFRQVASGRFVFIGSGAQRKSLCDVRTAAETILFLAQRKRWDHEVVTVADAEAFPVRQIVDWIAAAAGVRPPTSLMGNGAAAALALVLRPMAEVLHIQRQVRQLRSWLAESVHPPLELEEMGFEFRHTTREGIGHCFRRPR